MYETYIDTLESYLIVEEGAISSTRKIIESAYQTILKIIKLLKRKFISFLSHFKEIKNSKVYSIKEIEKYIISNNYDLMRDFNDCKLASIQMQKAIVRAIKDIPKLTKLLTLIDRELSTNNINGTYRMVADNMLNIYSFGDYASSTYYKTIERSKIKYISKEVIDSCEEISEEIFKLISKCEKILEKVSRINFGSKELNNVVIDPLNNLNETIASYSKMITFVKEITLQKSTIIFSTMI